jgi:hypothetical protein
MTTEPNEQSAGPAFPGIPLPEFDAAVKVLKTLRDNAKYTIMLVRLGAVRMVGAAEDFRQALPCQ